MSVLQYIGARYVPKFYVNSVDGSTRWEPNVEYEPLTWVTLQNGEMYLSKKTVPVAIGTPAENEDYWLEVGEFDGYIRELQNQINEINDEKLPAIEHNIKTFPSRSTLNTKRWIFLGDSYAEGAICTGGTSWDDYTYTRNYEDGWMYKLINWYLGLNSAQYYAQPTGGASFSLEGGHHWQDLLNSMEVENPETIDYIVVLGGANDFPSTRNEILLGMQAFKNVVATRFPNATVILGMIGNTNRAYAVENIAKTFNAYKDGCAINGFTYMSGIENILHHNKYMGRDYLHCTGEGYTEVAINAYNFLVNGSIDYLKYEKVSDIQSNWGFNISGNNQTVTADVWTYVNNDKVGIDIGRLMVQMQTGITLNAGNPISFMTSASRSLDIVGNQGISAYTVPQYIGNGTAILTLSNNSFKTVPFSCEMVDNILFIAFYNLSTSGWANEQVKGIQIYGLHLEMPTMADM